MRCISTLLISLLLAVPAMSVECSDIEPQMLEAGEAA
jgi:hypothetical protein